MSEWIVTNMEFTEDGAERYGYKRLVRCKDCKYYWKNSKYKSNMEDMENVAMCLASPSDDAFCSEGEGQDDEAD